MLTLRARMPLVLVVVLLGAGTLNLSSLHFLGAAPSRESAPDPKSHDTVHLVRNLPPEQFALFAAALKSRDPSGLLLLDTKDSAGANRAFLDAWKPSRLVPIGEHDDVEKLAEKLGLKAEMPHDWSPRPPLSFWKTWFPRADAVVVCPPEPRALVLQSTCLAGTLRAPLYIQHGTASDNDELRHLVHFWATKKVFVVGSETPMPVLPAGVRIEKLADATAVAREHRRALSEKTTIRTAVIANPIDDRKQTPGMSVLSAWIALEREAALILTCPDGSDVEKLVDEAVRTKPMQGVETLILTADLEAIPFRQRKNPIPTDKDEFIEMEPMTPVGTEPYSYSIGRLFHQDPGIVPLLLARQRLQARDPKPARALVVSNTGGSLPLLETLSRQTVRELTNAGVETTAMYGKKTSGDEVRKELPKHNLFLWEGHHNTLIKDWKFPEWDEPLQPSMVFLQSCLALREWKVEGLFRRGAVGVIGASSRIYSASGGATSLSFFDAVLHEDCNAGDALRQSKNFLQAYMLLKEGRLGDEAKRQGANQRAAWAFTLWGDPTWKLPRAASPKVPPVTHTVKSNVVTLHLPTARLDAVRTDKYHVEAAANSRLAGLVGKEKGDDGKALQAMVFAEVHLPKAPDGKVPRLTSKLPSKSWVFNWDARRKTGWLLAVPREKDKDELRFVVKWEDAEDRSASTGMVR